MINKIFFSITNLYSLCLEISLKKLHWGLVHPIQSESFKKLAALAPPRGFSSGNLWNSIGPSRMGDSPKIDISVGSTIAS